MLRLLSVIETLRVLDVEMPAQVIACFLYIASFPDGCTTAEMQEKLGLTAASMSRNTTWLTGQHRSNPNRGLNLITKEVYEPNKRLRILRLTSQGRALALRLSHKSMTKKFTWGEALDYTLKTKWKGKAGLKTNVINTGHFTSFAGRSFPVERINQVQMDLFATYLRDERDLQDSRSTVALLQSAPSLTAVPNGSCAMQHLYLRSLMKVNDGCSGLPKNKSRTSALQR